MRVLSGAIVAAALVWNVGAMAQPRRGAPAGRGAAPPPAPAAKPAPLAEARVPFKVGETLTYDVAWAQYLVAGTATSRVVDKRPSGSSTAYYIVAEGRPLPLIARIYALYYKMDSLLDSATTLSQRSSLYQEEGSRKRFAVTTFNRQAKSASFEVQTDTNVKDHFPIPQNVQDGLATLYALRARTFRAGDHLSIPVADEGNVYTVSIDATGPVQMKVRLGQLDAWNLRVSVVDAKNQPVGSNIGAWISTDERRLPLRLQGDLPVGNFVLALRSVE
jgi:Protein of unknown function (DUF3108)